MEKIYKYIEDHVTPQGEALDWVEKQTHIMTNHARMLSGKLQGELLRIIVQTSGAKRILELGGAITTIRRNYWGHHPHGLDDTEVLLEFHCKAREE